MKIVFVTNRPNYCHRRFAESIDCKFYHVKGFLPKNIPVLSLTSNGLLNSIKLPEADIYFAESIMDYYPVYYKGKGKKIMLIAEDTLFKMESMSGIKKNYIMKLFRSADGFIAVSELCKKMLLKYVSKPVRVAYPFPHKEFFHIKSKQNGKKVLFIGRNDKNKGFMELVEAVKTLRKKDKSWELYLIGECSKSVKAEDGINPLGFVKDMDEYFKICTFLVHPAAFDACPATIFEAMSAGMIPVISGNIGQTEIFRKNKFSDLILKSNSPAAIASKLESLSSKDTRKLSVSLKKLCRDFREEKRLFLFKKEFKDLVNNL